MFKNKIKLGIVGCGHVTNNNHLPVILANDEIDLKWVYDKDLTKSKNTANLFNLNFLNQIDDFSVQSIDILLIAIPLLNRDYYYNLIFKHNKSALIEKPAFNNYKNFLYIKEKIIRNNNIINYGFQRRFYKNINYLKSLISNNFFGTIKKVYIGEGSRVRRSERDGNWYLNDLSQSGGGILIETGSHTVDLISYIFEPDDIKVINYNENLSFNNVEMDVSISLNIFKKNTYNFPAEIDISYLKDLKNLFIIEFENLKLVMQNSLVGKIYLQNDKSYTTSEFNINYDNDIDYIFKYQLKNFMNFFKKRDFKSTLDHINIVGTTTKIIDECYSFNKK